MTTQTDEARIAERLKLYRRLAGLTQRDAADSLDVTEKTIARWESAETTGFMGQLDRIAKAYGTTVAELREGGQDDRAAMEAQLGQLAEEVRALRELLLDPERLREAARQLIEEERKAGRNRRGRRPAGSSP